MDALLIRRSESHFDGGEGRMLFARSWTATEPERVVVICHGYAEHSGRYEHVGSWLARRGCSVDALDLQGHGRSDGPRGHAKSLDALVDDLESAVARARAAHPRLPLFVLGHSMGGLVALAYAVTRRPAIAGLVSSGAALEVPDVPSPAARLALRVMRRLLPRLSMPRPCADEALSRDPEVGIAYRADPLVFQTMTVSLAAAIYYGGVQTLAAAGDLALPAFLLHGADDPLVAPSGSQRFAEAVARDDCELRILPGLRHEILNEPEWEDVLSDVLRWMTARECTAEATG